CDFYGNRIIVNHNVLIPRFETEILCEKAIEIVERMANNVGAVAHDRPQILDLCTGSGCIALTLAKKTSAKIVASDKSEKALSVAKNNVEGTDVEVVFSDLFDNLKGRKFDLIVSNPPYIKSDDIEGLEIEVKSYEPLEALDGGKDGLDFYRKIIATAPNHLKKGGVILFEVGQGQADEVAVMLEKDFVKVEKIKDLDGIERIVRGEVK
ncbi:MAG: peptide chain release factor N(5)-glutamine methyltransferase, partial [Firmicutes bacterium]|nr:peptide chain release factor N(5)-glutamine methyltransferase [Bacillota bacterium]